MFDPATARINIAYLPECTQGLLKDQLEIVKVKHASGKFRYAIQPLEEQLPFDKVTTNTLAVFDLMLAVILRCFTKQV